MILRYQPKIEMAAGLDYVPSSLYSGLNHATRISLYMVAGSRLRDSLNHTSVLVSYSIGSCGHGLYSRPLSPTSTNASLIAHKQRCRILSSATLIATSVCIGIQYYVLRPLSQTRTIAYSCCRSYALMRTRGRGLCLVLHYSSPVFQASEK